MRLHRQMHMLSDCWSRLLTDKRLRILHIVTQNNSSHRFYDVLGGFYDGELSRPLLIPHIQVLVIIFPIFQAFSSGSRHQRAVRRISDTLLYSSDDGLTSL
jgi:hypothetical protein